MAFPLRDQRHRYLRYEGLQYIDADIVDFETRLAKIYRRKVHKVQVFDFRGLPDLMAEGLRGRMLMKHKDMWKLEMVLNSLQKTYNNDKSLSEIQLEHEKEDEFVVVVKTRGGSKGESFGEEGDDFGVDCLRFHTCLTDILGFLERLEWWFEQDIDDDEEEDNKVRVVVRYENVMI
ncbi:hypothetical protein Tco_0549647 [Tanacetum coccineum]